jgi:hypothetical protein
VNENEKKDIGITSPHVIWEGCSAKAPMEGGDKEIGHCTWPPGPVGVGLDARILDMAVIEIQSEMANKISTSKNISVYADQKDELEFQKVYKHGWKSGETTGDIEMPQFNMFGKKVMVITTEDGKDFSEPGDSGALVLTKKGTQLLALGLIFGGELAFRENDKDFPKNASIAIYFDEAISRFETGSGKGNIEINRY